MFTLREVECLGSCANAPMIQVSVNVCVSVWVSVWVTDCDGSAFGVGLLFRMHRFRSNKFARRHLAFVKLQFLY